MKKSIFKKALFMLLVISVMFNVDAQQVRTINNLPFIQNNRIHNSNPIPPKANSKFRTIDGTFNNISSSSKIEFGASEVKLAREIPAEYSDK
ncbi:MAG: hypothetical protein WBB26_06395, partial [Saprospiraceae bacterium]